MGTEEYFPEIKDIRAWIRPLRNNCGSPACIKFTFCVSLWRASKEQRKLWLKKNYIHFKTNDKLEVDLCQLLPTIYLTAEILKIEITYTFSSFKDIQRFQYSLFLHESISSLDWSSRKGARSWIMEHIKESLNHRTRTRYVQKITK